MDRDDIAREARAALLGTADSLDVWLDDHHPDFDSGEIYSLLDIERCPTCDRWAGFGELIFGDGEIGTCGSCL